MTNDQLTKKRVLIISLNGGAGHYRAADALLKTAETFYGNTIEASHVDVLDFLTPTLKKTVMNSYEIMIRRAPGLWAALYHRTNNLSSTKTMRTMSQLLKHRKLVQMLKFISEWKPDYIISTHAFPSVAIELVREMYDIRAPLGIVVTDYDIHTLWIAQNTPQYFVANEKMKWKLNSFGVPEKNVTVCGIPVHPQFYDSFNRNEIAKKHGIPTNNKIILVLAGGKGLAHIDEVVENIFALKEEMTVVAVAGKNSRLQSALSALKAPPNIFYKTIGWTDSIHELMALSDIVVTKPGGITTSECIVMQKPMIAVQPIPGQEECNAEFILENGLGKIAKDGDDLIYYLHLPAEKIAPAYTDTSKWKERSRAATVILDAGLNTR